MENKRGKSKKAQLTIFIIIAVVMVAVVLSVIFIQRGGEAPQAEVQVVKEYLDSCFEEKAKETILENARKGFYYELSEEKISFLDEKTAYYFKNGEVLVPGTTTVEQQFALAMDKKILPCLALTQFRNEYEITRQDCFSEAKLNDDSVQFSINCPMTIKKDGVTATLEDFETTIFCNARKLINVSSLLIDEYKKKPGYVCITCFDEIADANNVKIDIIPITKEVFIPEHIWFIIQDKEKIDDKNFTLRFVTD